MSGRLHHEKPMKHGKKYRAISEKIAKDKSYAIGEALAILKESAAAKFDEAVEVHVRMERDRKKKEQEQARGTVTLPHGTGKTLRIGVITSTKADEAKSAGADVVGGEELIAAIKGGAIPSVDVLLATPEMMPKIAAAAKVLGPRGLMPSPKTETVTMDIATAVAQLKKGKANFKGDDAGNIHQIIGKLSFFASHLSENYEAFLAAVRALRKPITGIVICTTMGPSVRINL